MAECSDSSVSNSVNIQKQKAAAAQSERTEEDKTDEVWKPFLLEEIKHDVHPKSFLFARQELLRRNFGSLDKNDILVVMVYIMMLEEGFVPKAKCKEKRYDWHFNLSQILELASEIPRDWKRTDGLYVLPMVLWPFQQQVCNIVCTLALDDIVINSRVTGVKNSNYSLLIDPSMYIVSSATNIMNRYQNIRQLVVHFKNNISNKSKADILRTHNIPTATFQDLPVYVKLFIEKYVSVPSELTWT